MSYAERTLVAAVAEDREPYRSEVVCLFGSIRHLGGSLSGTKLVAYFVESIDPATTGRLGALGVEVGIVPRPEPRCPHANKLQALDTDTVVCRDFSAYVAGSSVRARPAGKDPMTVDQWRVLFDRFGLDLPGARYVTSHDMGETVPYFNSGVLIVPRALVSPLRESWLRYVRALLDAYRDLPNVAPHARFSDQIALPLALVAAGLPYAPLPLEMNFLAHTRVHPAAGPELLSPYIVHHHHGLLPDGTLRESGMPNIDEAIGRVNAAVSALSGD